MFGFEKQMFANARQLGYKASRKKLEKAMLDILLQLPTGTVKLKETIVYNLGFMGQLASTREINDAWNQTKKQAAKLHPEKFTLGERNVLHWNDGKVKVIDKKISTANFKKLNEIAQSENCSVDKLVGKLIKNYQNKGNEKKPKSRKVKKN